MNLNEQATCLTPDYRTIPLTKGQVTIVDAADYEWLSQWKWHTRQHRRGGSYYAVRQEMPTRKFIYMHRLILGLAHGDKRYGDHRNHERTLDNRRSNLRIATCTQNAMNRGKTQSNTSGYKGVYKARDKWEAKMYINGRSVSLGSFFTRKAAHLAYRAAAVKHYGEFAKW